MLPVNSFSSAENSDISSSNIKVFVRARPPEENVDSDFIQYLHEDNEKDKIIIRDPELPANASKKYSDASFQFDKVYWKDSDQEDVFNTTCKPQVDHVINGYNSCCFAYGQTGSGKTYTMFGSEEGTSRGVTSRAIEYLFERIGKLRSKKVAVFCSFLEIYNDQLRDLGKAYLIATKQESSPTSAIFERTSDLFESLESKRKDSFYSRAFNKSRSKLFNLDDMNPDIKQVQDEYNTMNYEIHEDNLGNIFVKDLSLIPISRAEDALDVISIGGRVRAVAETKLNPFSSRSHTVFTITVIQKEEHSSDAITGTLNLVDLAGSERLKRSESQGIRLREALHINTSLAALGKVIMALDSASEGSHIPYRDSKLTRLLQNSLGGNSFTVLIATIHPTVAYYEECMSTLYFAYRCKNIKNHPRMNYLEDSQGDKDRKIRRLQDELTALRSKYSTLEASHSGGTLPMSKVIAFLQKVGMNATATGEGALVLNDGRIIEADQLDLSVDPAIPSVSAPASPTSVEESMAMKKRLSVMASRSSNLLSTVATDVKWKKALADLQADNDSLRSKLKEKKVVIDQLTSQVRELNQKLVQNSTVSKHTEHELRLHLSDADHHLKEVQATLEAKFESEKKQLIKNSNDLLKEQQSIILSIPNNLRNFTKSVREHEDVNIHNDLLLQKKYDSRLKQIETSHQQELSHLKSQYEYFLNEKKKELSHFANKFSQYREKKTSQLRICEKEIVLLYEYSQKLEDIIKNAERGEYAVRQTAGASSLPTTGLFETRETNQNRNSTGPLRLGGILLPRATRPVNPLDSSANGEPLSLARKLIKKHKDEQEKLNFQKEQAFHKSLGATPLASDADAPLDPVLQSKIHSLFLNTDHFAPTNGTGGVNGLNSLSASINGGSVSNTRRRSVTSSSTEDNGRPQSQGILPSQPTSQSRTGGFPDAPPAARPSTSYEPSRDKISGRDGSKPRVGWSQQQQQPQAPGTLELGPKNVVSGDPYSLQQRPYKSRKPSLNEDDEYATEGSVDEIEQMDAQLKIAMLQEELDLLRKKEVEKEVNLQLVMQELEGNTTLEYISFLETNQEKLQRQLRDVNAQLQSSKVTNASLQRMIQKQEVTKGTLRK